MIEEVTEQMYLKADGIAVGQFVWAPVPHLEEVPRILEVERAAGEVHHASKFRVVQMTKDHFRARDKLPIAALTLGNTEELLISKAKKRPCLVICCNNTAFDDRPILDEVKGRKHLQDKSLLLVPLYGIATPQDERGFPPKMVARIRVFLYSQFFYLPRKCTKGNYDFGQEGIARLDRIFAASPSRGVESMGVRLAAEPLKLLMAQVCERFGTAEHDELRLVRQLLDSALPEDCRPVV